MRCITYVLLAIFLMSPQVLADQVFKWTDAQGKTYYSTQPRNPNDSPTKLPYVQKENIDKRIQKIKLDTPPNCLNHGNEDCSKGPDTDGSVICSDGYRDAVLPFRFYCLETKLRAEMFLLADKAKKRISFSKSAIPKDPTKLHGIEIAVRNTTSVAAQKVIVEFHIPEPNTAGMRIQELRASGPEKIEPYGLASYTLVFNHSAYRLRQRELRQGRYKISCHNCR